MTDTTVLNGTTENKLNPNSESSRGTQGGSVGVPLIIEQFFQVQIFTILHLAIWQDRIEISFCPVKGTQHASHLQALMQLSYLSKMTAAVFYRGKVEHQIVIGAMLDNTQTLLCISCSHYSRTVIALFRKSGQAPPTLRCKFASTDTSRQYIFRTTGAYHVHVELNTQDKLIAHELCIPPPSPNVQNRLLSKTW